MAETIEEQICSISILTQPFEQQKQYVFEIWWLCGIFSSNNFDYIAAVLGRKENVQRKY